MSKVKCSCGFECGKEDKLLKHLTLEHKISSLEEGYRILILKGPRPTCKCGCEKETPFLGWRKGYGALLKGHNASIYSLYSEDEARAISKKRIDKLTGREGWSKGLTKETDARVAQRAEKTSAGRKKAFNEGKILTWSKGLTKETDSRLKDSAEQARKSFASGERVSWHTGLTAETDARIKSKNESLKEGFASGRLKAWHAGLTKETDSRLRAKAEAGRDLTFAEKMRLSEEAFASRISSLKNLKFVGAFSDYRNSNLHSLKFQCGKCDNVSIESLQTCMTDRCRSCDPFASRPQQEVYDWIASRFPRAFINDRVSIKPYELDVYVPEKRVAVELHGIYYHTEQFISNQNYHDVKRQRTEAAGIKLVQIFEDEWRDKREIVESMLLHALGASSHKIGARQCEVLPVNKSDRKDFFEQNHLEGDTLAKVAFGLYDGDELVACVSLRDPMHKGTYDGCIEIARFATKKNTSVQGGLSKLLKECKKFVVKNSYKGLITYADTRIGQCKSYEKVGMRLIGQTSPRFWWTDHQKRYNRFKFRADPSRGMTEAQVADEAGVVRIWGCSNLIYRLDVTPE